MRSARDWSLFATDRRTTAPGRPRGGQMNETTITLTGWLGGEVTRRDANGVPVADFRVATTPRRFNRRTEEWVDGNTQWYSVTVWRQLADNCTESLRRGDPVVIHGRLSADTWTNSAGIEVSSMKIEATFVGHDLTRGVSRFTRNPRPVSDDPGRAEPVEETASGERPETDASAA
jgi:single-strand DNA-binding protein